MATFIDMVRSVRLLSGMQGTGPSSVVDATGVEEVLVKFVKDAYVDVQSLREEFDFLEAATSFNTVATQDTYTKLQIFGTSTPNFKKYNLHSFRITNSNGKKQYLQYVDSNVLEAQFLNSDNEELPKVYTIDPATKGVILKPIPNGIYTVEFRYWEQPEILEADADVPKLPLHFHNLIVYKALEKTAIFLNSPELYRNYSTEANRMIGQLMRMELKKKRIYTGALV